MTVQIIQGNLLDAFDRGEINVIGHCCNAQGKMNSGIAKSIRERYPIAYEKYMYYFINSVMQTGHVIGVNVGWESDNKRIYNLIGQKFYGYDGRRYLNYGAIGKCLSSVAERCKISKDVIGFPYKMGCDRAGGDWGIVLEMIEFYFKEHDVKIYKLEE